MTYSRTSTVPRLLQQQPQRPVNRQQQQSSGSGEFQPVRQPPGMSGQMGDQGERPAQKVSDMRRRGDMQQ